MNPAWAALAAAAAAGLGDLVNRRWRGWLPDDPPRPGRKQHARPIPLAGIVLLPVVLPWLLAGGRPWLAAGLLVAAATGFADDRGKERGADLGWRPKAVGLALAAALAATGTADPRTAPLAWLGAAAAIWLLTNATNFLDNTDGVATSLAAVSLLVLAGPDAPVAALGFAALGFLPWNWPRPQLFLGDAGAYLLGLGTGALAAEVWLQHGRALAAAAATAVQLADFTQVVAARLWLRLPPWVGDRRHLPHILQNLGLPRPLVAPLLAALAAAAGWLGSRA